MNLVRAAVVRNSKSVMESSIIKMGKWRHHKGVEYETVDVVKHSEILEALVVYKALYKNFSLWVRPLSMFLEEVEVEGKKKPRFRYI